MPREDNCWPFKYEFNKEQIRCILSSLTLTNTDILLISETKLDDSFV